MADHHSSFNRDGAVREVAQAYELIKTHQPLLLLHQGPSSPTTQLAQNLLNEALRALNVALQAMKHHQPPPRPAADAAASIKSEPGQLSSFTSPANSTGGSPAALDRKRVIRKAQKRRRTEEDKCSWVSVTAVPHEDGYQWRKYGEKKIHGTHFTRSYFRCTYRDDKGCQATKRIQQKDNAEQPMFQVTYNNEHTCNGSTGAATSSIVALLGYGDSAGIMQEAPEAPPPAEVSSDQTQVPQEAFPTSNNGIPTTGAGSWSCSDVAAVSCCDKFDLYTRQTTTAPAAVMEQVGLRDDPFCDIELLLLYDSFKHY